MLDLFRKNDSVVIQIGEAEITCKPYRSQDYAITKFKTFKAIQELKEQRKEELEQGIETIIPNLDDTEVMNGVFNCLFNTELAKLVILKWKNVGIRGKKISVTPENIELLMADGALQESFFLQYMEKQRQVEEEKK